MKKSTKRITAILIALVMLISCSIGVISASAAPSYDMNVVTSMKNAMAAYEAKMNGTVYVGTVNIGGEEQPIMSTAYKYYVQVSRYLDRYYYANDAVSPTLYNGAINNLNKCVAAMTTAFTPYSANNPDPIDGSYKKSDLINNATLSNENGSIYGQTDHLSGVILTGGLGGTTPWTELEITGSKSGIYTPHGMIGVQYGFTVFLYTGPADGTNTIYGFPVNMVYRRTDSGATFRPGYVRVDTTGLSLNHFWHGSGTNNSYDANPGYKGTSESVNYQNDGLDRPAYGHQKNNDYMSNTLYFTGTLSNTEYMKSIDAVTWQFYYSNSGKEYAVTLNSSSNKDKTLGDPTIYILNYKALVDQIYSTTNINYLNNVNNYKEGGLDGLMTAYDNATSYNPNNDFNSVTTGNAASALPNAVSNAQTKLRTYTEAFRVTPTKDGYASLRTAIDTARDLYYNNNNGVNPLATDGVNYKYCVQPWETFAELFATVADQRNTARGNSDAFMKEAADVDTGSSVIYDNPAQAADYATKLTAAYNAVKEHVTGNDKQVKIPEGENYKKATCTANGLGVEYSTCPNCKTEYINNNAYTITPLGHTLEEQKAGEATCTTPGTERYWYCVSVTDDLHDACGLNYKDSAGTTVLEGEPEQVDPLHHDFVQVQEAKPSTCLNGSYVAVYKCNNCGLYFRSADDDLSTANVAPEDYLGIEQDDKKEHSFVEHPEVPNDCTQAGNIYYVSCNNCETLFNSMSADDVMTGDPFLPQLAHSFVNYVDDDNYSCITNGTETATCEICNEATDTKVVKAATGHDFNYEGAKTDRVLPTCVTGGNVEYYTCKECGKNFNTDNIWSVSEVPADQLSIDATGVHSLVQHYAVTASCQNAGWNDYWQCSVCNILYDSADQSTGEVIDDLETWSGYTAEGEGEHVLVPFAAQTATCLVDGWDDYWYCALCHNYYSSGDQTVGHDKFEESKIETDITQWSGYHSHETADHNIGQDLATDANCIEPGFDTHFECSVCHKWFLDEDGNEETDEKPIGEKDPDKHTGNWIYNSKKDATCKETGFKIANVQCKDCGYFYANTENVTEADRLTEEQYIAPTISHDQDKKVETEVGTIPATCTVAGQQMYFLYCSMCETLQGATSEPIPTIPHTPKHVDEQGATCYSEGLEEHYECDVCGQYFALTDTKCESDPITRDDIVIPSDGHKFTVLGDKKVDESCNTNAIFEYSCEYECGNTEQREKEGTMSGHHMTTHAQKDATCLESGVPETYYSCDKCGLNYNDGGDYTTDIYSGDLSTPATGHRFELKDPGKEPTCAAGGSKAYYACANNNCDLGEGTKFVYDDAAKAYTAIENDNELILEKDEYNHTNLKPFAADPANCATWTSGYDAYIYCSGCTNYYESYDLFGEVPLVNGKDDLEAAPAHKLTHHDAQPADCLNYGWDAYYICDVCDELFLEYHPNNKTDNITEDDFVHDPKGHSFGAYVPAVDPTCTVDGNKGYYQCSVCNIKVICAEADKELENVKFYDGDDSDDISVDATGHSFVLVDKDAKAATCVAEGIKAHYECANANCDLTKDGVKAKFLYDGNTAEYKQIASDSELNIPKDPDNHVNLDYDPGSAADCTTWTKGVRANYHCDCGVYYELNDIVKRANPKTAEAFVSTPQHTLADKGEKAETCLVDGYKQHWECTVCHQFFTANDATVQHGVDYDTEIKAGMTGHKTRTEKENETPGADCKHYGTYEEVVYCDNTWCDLNGAAISRETKTDTKVGPHTPGEATQENVVPAKCETAGSYDLVTKCTVCDEVTDTKANQTIDPTGHKDGEVKIENEKKGADCQHFGTYEEVTYCANEWCEVEGGKVLSRVTKETTEVGDHVAGDPQREDVVEATCEVDGSYDLVTRCTLCKAELTRVENQVITKTGHTNGEVKIENEKQGADCQHFGTYDEVIYCANEWCDVKGGKELSRVTKETAEVGDHVAGKAQREDVIEANCTDKGSYDLVTRCELCGTELDRVKDQVIPAKGHSFGAWEPVKSPDCVNGGSQKRTCKVCGVVENKNLNPNGHAWEDGYTIDKAATCTEKGSKSIHCKNCDAQKDSVPVSALGHDWVIDKAVESTVTETGLTEGKHCSRCDVVVPQEVTPNKLAILEGANQTYVIASGKEKTIRCSGPINMFVELLLEGKHVDEANYTLKEGSTIVTFNSAFLNTLTPGVYKVTLVYTYDSIDTTLTVVEKSTEAPSDTTTEKPTTTEAPTVKPTETPTEPTTEASTEATTEAPAETTTEATTDKDKAPVSNDSSKSPGTGFVLSIPVFSLAALAGSSFFLGYARKKKNEDEE